MAAELGIAEQSCFLGQIPRQQLGSEYQSCHVVCIPSRSDPFPTVAIEAMAAGRPVIGAAVGGIPWSIANEKSGLLVKPEEPSELADALERAAGDPQKLAAMGLYGHQECHRRFNWNGIVRQLAKAINETIDRQAAPTLEATTPRSDEAIASGLTSMPGRSRAAPRLPS